MKSMKNIYGYWFCYITFNLLVIFMISCSNDKKMGSANLEESAHPTEENTPRYISQEISKAPKPDLRNYKRLQKLIDGKYKTIFTIGEDVESHEGLLGEVETALFTKDDRILVLDSNRSQIKIYDLEGNLIKNFGRPGRGPGEFMIPEAMALSSNNKLIVINRGNRINIYDYQNGSIEFENTILVKYVPEDLCTLNDKFIVRGVEQPNQELNANILHEYSAKTGEHLRSLGSSYKSNNWLVVNQLSDGPIACNHESNNIIKMYEYLPYIYSYDLEDSLKWVTKINDFDNFEITEEYRGGNIPSVVFKTATGGSEMGYNLKSIFGDKVILQARKKVNERYQYLTYALNSKDGKGVFLGDNIPIIYAQNGNKLIISGSSDFLSLRLIEL